MQISFSFHDYKRFCSVVEMFRSWTPKYSEVLRSTRSTSEYSWSKLGVLQSTPELLRSTPEYSGILSSTPEYSKVLQNIVRRKHQFLLRLKSGCCRNMNQRYTERYHFTQTEGYPAPPQSKRENREECTEQNFLPLRRHLCWAV